MFETRMLSRGLSPVAVESHGLMAGLLELTLTTQRLSRIACRFQCTEPVPVSDNSVATHLYRIAQEAIHNAVKHARPKTITVTLSRSGPEALLEIVDDGPGLIQNSERNGGMGLRTMKYRADVIGGKLELSSAPAEGTRVACAFRCDFDK
jgi:signal transduction histidine kinase